MSRPGWYPDPDGSGRPRWWDGRAWAALAGAPDDGRRDHRGTRYWVIGGLVAVALVIAMMVWQPWRSDPFALPTDTATARPTGSQWNELEPSATPTEPTPTDTGGRPVECPIVDEEALSPSGDRFVSGDVAYTGVPGWLPDGAWTIDFASERSGQMDWVADDWVAITAIGQLSRKDFGPDARTAAGQILDCMSSSFYYRTLLRRENLMDRSFSTRDGLDGWLLRANFWNIPQQAVTGDEVTVVVLDTGDADHLTLFHTEAPIEDDKRKELVYAALESLGRR